MHPRNLHNKGYDFAVLSSSYSKLKPFLIKTPVGNTSIDFSDAIAVQALNAALLAHFYAIKNWQIPAEHLCPPVPGRADYIHYVADLLAENTTNMQKTNKLPSGQSIVGLDIGVGANLIYPILGSQIYGWRFVGSELSKTSMESANKIIRLNRPALDGITLKQQTDSNNIFTGIIGAEDRFEFSMCNPPFHASQKLAEQGNRRKNRNLALNKLKRHQGKTNKANDNNKLNFSGNSSELWCNGGEIAFIKRMAIESQRYSKHVKWFTSLVSKKENIKPIYRVLETLNVAQVKTVQMDQGNKISRFIAWKF